MGRAPFQNITLSGQQFENQILRSHLLVASLGLVVVLIALASIILLRIHILSVVRDWEPVDRAASRILAEVQSSLANLRGWVVLGDTIHLENWEQAWNKGIEPNIEKLLRHTKRLDDPETQKILERLHPLLRKLYVSQWLIQDIAQTPGNEPAKATIERYITPVAEKLEHSLSDLIQKYHHANALDHREHVALLEVESPFRLARMMLESFVYSGQRQHESQFREAFQKSWHTFNAWVETYPHPMPKHQDQDQDLATTIQKAFLALDILTNETIQQRKTEKWNVAQSLMRTQAVPRAQKVLDVISTLLTHSLHVTDQHASHASLVSAVAITVLLILLVGMIFLAYFLSKQRAWTLTHPIWNLIQGTQAFAEGKLDRDIPITDENELGTLTHAFNTMRRSLQQSKKEQEKYHILLERRANDLVQTNQELRDFVYIVSHDLRSPLVSIQGFIEEVQIDMDELGTTLENAIDTAEKDNRDKISDLLNRRLPEDLGYIRASTDKMNRLINAILKLSRLGHSILQWEKVHLPTLIEQDLQASAHAIKAAGVTVTVGQLPAYLTTDRVSVAQIFGNLFSNAINYLESNRAGEITIDGSEDGEAQTVTLRIQDNGRGIAQEEIPKIFTLFKRVGKQDKVGEGVGLSYVQTLVRRLGGQIHCESTLGCGTLFSVVFPITPPKETQLERGRPG